MASKLLRLVALALCATSTNSCSSKGYKLPEAALGVRLSAHPSAFEPGEQVELRVEFPLGTGRIEPDVGTVKDGKSYRVGPFAEPQTYTLRVNTRLGIVKSTITIPVRYRDRIAEAPPSPLARTRHGSIALADGSILLVGGSSPGHVMWSNSERYDPHADTFTPVGELSTGRAGVALVLQPGGTVLAFGGDANTSSFEVATRVEEWSPAALAWSVRGNLRANRIRHTATGLGDGRVLVLGGVAVGGGNARAAEVWETGIGSRLPMGMPTHLRAAHTATRLADGSILLAGGYDPLTGAAVLAAERFDPVTETFTPAGTLADGRIYHAAVLLPDGRVWVGGGDNLVGGAHRSVELFDPATGTWSKGPALLEARTELRAVWLGSGELLVLGGLRNATTASDIIEFWQPGRGSRTATTRLPFGVTGHSIHRLSDGRVEIFGGDNGNGIPRNTHLVLD
jgi:hypothetical protein